MLTRNKDHVIHGYYTEERLETDEISLASLRKYASIINNIQYFILKNLKNKRKKSPIHKISLEISKSFQNFLINNYELGYKFKVCNDILFDLKIETERFIQTSSQSNCRFFIKPSSFMLKLNKKSKLEYFSKDEVLKTLEKNPSITVKFILTFSSLTLSDQTFLKNYM